MSKNPSVIIANTINELNEVDETLKRLKLKRSILLTQLQSICLCESENLQEGFEHGTYIRRCRVCGRVEINGVG